MPSNLVGSLFSFNLCYIPVYMYYPIIEKSFIPDTNWIFQFSSVQLLSCLWFFATPWTAACQASMPITNSQSLLKLMSIESMIPANHPILCHPLLLPPSIFPSIRVFSNESVLRIRGPKFWSFSFSFSPLFPLEFPGLISLQSKGHSRVFSNTQFKIINSSVLSFL